MIKTLIKKDLSIEYGFLLHPIKYFKDPKKRNQLFAGLFLFFLFGFYAFLIQSALFSNISELVNNNTYNLLIVSVASSHTFLMLITITSKCMSIFYFSNDINIMRTLPIKERDIILSKFVSLFIDSLLISAFLILPTFIRLSIYLKNDIISTIPVIITVLITNVFIITFISAIIIFLMRFLNKIPNLKNKFQVFTLVLSIGIWIIFSQFINNSESVVDVLENFSSTTWSYIPHIYFLIKVFNSDLVLSMAYTLIYAILNLVFILFTSNFMQKSLAKGIEFNSITSFKIKSNKKIKIKRRSIVNEVACKEFKEVLRTPIYFFNILSIGLVLIILIGIGVFNFISKDGGDLLSIIYAFRSKLGMHFLKELIISIIIGFIFTASICLNSSTLSTITREGKNINYLKTLPTTAKEQINGRLLASFWITMLNVLILILITTLIVLPYFYIPLGIILGSLVSWFFNSNANFYFGIKYPYFDWDTPQKAVKGGTNPLKSMLFSFTNAIIIYGLNKLSAYIFTDFFLRIVFAFIIFLIYSLLAGFILYYLNIKNFKKEITKYNIK